MRNRILRAATVGGLLVTWGSMALGATPIALPGGGAAVSSQPVVHETRSPSGLGWRPEFGWEAAHLVVVGGGGEVVRLDYSVGQEIGFSLVDDSGLALPDGRYSYQLRVRPAWDLAARRALAKVEDDEGEAARLESVLGPAVVRHWGQFKIRDGALEIMLDDPTARRDGSSAERFESRAESPGGQVSRVVVDSYGSFDFLCVGEDCPDTAAVFYTHEMRSEVPEIVFVDTSTSGTIRDWRLTSRDYFGIVDEGDNYLNLPTNVTLRIEAGTPEDTLHLGPGSAIGISTVPSEDVHILDGSPAVRLEDSSDNTHGAIRYNGGTLALEGNAGHNIVQIDATAPGASIDIDSVGQVKVKADFAVLSSRTVKKDLAPARPSEVLESLADLPLWSWRYKDNGAGALHLGPVAEDFHAAFGLGRDDRHLSPTDMAGVALAAAQALYGLSLRREQEIADLRRENSQLRSGLEDLRRRLGHLASESALDGSEPAGRREVLERRFGEVPSGPRPSGDR